MIESADDRLEVEPTHRDDLAFWNFSGEPPASLAFPICIATCAFLQSFNSILGVQMTISSCSSQAVLSLRPR
jgi:hypothetical protein